MWNIQQSYDMDNFWRPPRTQIRIAGEGFIQRHANDAGRGVAWQNDFLCSLQVPMTTFKGSDTSGKTEKDKFLSSWHGGQTDRGFYSVQVTSTDKSDVRTRLKRKMSLAGVKSIWNSWKDSLRERFGNQGDDNSNGQDDEEKAPVGNIEEIMETLDQFSVRRPSLVPYESTYDAKRNPRHLQGEKNHIIGPVSPFFVPRKEANVWNNICDMFWRPGLIFCPYEWGLGQLTSWNDLWVRGAALKGLLMDTYCPQDLLQTGDAGSSLHDEDETEEELLELIKLILRCGPAKVLRLLLQLQIIDVNMTLGEAGGLLHVACIARNYDIITLLCTVGIDPRIRDFKGRTAGQMTFSGDVRRLLSAAYLTNTAPLSPPAVCGSSDRRSIFDMAKDPHQLDQLLIKLQVMSFDINREMNDEGDLLIHVICKQGVKQGAALMLLVQKFGANVNAFSRQGYTPLMLSVLGASDVMAQLLICVLGANPNCCEYNTGYTACHLAANYNYFDILGSLIRRGADFNMEGKDGRRPEDVATVAGSAECVAIIHQERYKRIANLKDKITTDTLMIIDLKPSDIITPDENDVTLLIFAVQQNSIKSLETLLSVQDIPKDAQDPKTGQTAMMVAAACGHDAALSLLLSKGCDPRVTDMEQLMAIHHAVRGSHLSCVSVLLTSENPILSGLQKGIEMAECPKVKALLQQAKFRRQVEIVRPILWKCAVSGDDATLYQILEEGDDVYAGSNSRTENPIFLAASNGHLEVLKLLLQHGGDIMGYYGNASSTLLHVACQYGHIEVARHVLHVFRTQMAPQEKQTLINSTNRYGKTALQLAADTGRTELVSLLLQEGASTALVDSNGNLYQCEQFEGIQYMLETARRYHTTAVINAILSKKMDSLKQIWMPKLDHNLRDLHGDTPLMLTVRQGTSFLSALQFLLSSAVYENNDKVPASTSPIVNKFLNRWKPSNSVLMGIKETKDPVSVEPSEDASVDSAFELDEGIIEDHDIHYAEQSSEAAFSERAESFFSNDERSRMGSIFHAFLLPSHVYQSGGKVSHVCAQNSRDGQTALHYAIRLTDGASLAVVLLKTDPSVLSISDKAGMTPLHLACKLNRPDAVRLLLSQIEVDINARTLDGQLPDELTNQPVILKALQSARAPQSSSPTFMHFADNVSRPGSLSGASVDFEAINTRFQLVKKKQKQNPSIPPSYKS